MVLVDTSVWIDHFRASDERLRQLLFDEEVVMHSFMLGEIACGSLKNRTEVLKLLAALPRAIVATDQETMQAVETHKLMGRGLGWVDVHLVSSCLLSKCSLWTRDKALALVSSELKLAAD